MDPAAAPVVLRDYALLADGERGIIIGPHGDLVWMCFPRWHDRALFSALIGGGGSYAVTPIERHVWGGYYEPGSLIWRSRWVTNRATIECREALALPSAPNRAVILRRIVACQGTARVRCTLRTRADFGTAAPRAVRREGDTWVVDHGHVRLRWGGAGKARMVRGERDTLQLDLVVPNGSHHDLVMSVEAGDTAEGLPDAGAAWSATEAAWKSRIPPLSQSLAPRDAQHACAVMLGLTSAAGGMVAAATTSLPERARQSTSYDYRFAWIRDQCYAGHAALAAGVDELADSAVAFVSERLLADGPNLKPAYTVDGGPVPDQRRLHLPGYPGGTDIVGNWVNGQFQLDACGETLLLLAGAAKRDRLDVEGWRALETAVSVIEARWQEPDAGIWELEPHHWTHSRLSCVAGLRAAAKVAPTSSGATAAWMALADAILARSGHTSVRDDGAWQRAEDDPRVDAALLIPTVRGAVALDDPRSRATLAVIEHELVEDGYVYRFRHDARPLGEAEGAFLLCGFMMALRKHVAGDPVGAVRWFERTRGACGPAGLFCEEYDVRERQLRGNLPQAFVHALLLESAITLAT
ncbi:MAG: glycoside hydrolase [Candidatus Aeolococcus gillhamiae]|uniref:Glycoside hydrolase n=1 Tax=Candidatus Aeolococcus gillhamiae TaxID=3127015 RepID=A0A2W5ZI45_9BACT|nr:MAG: glycoside hydrolase [Candidatus Dormibacter sp. RRmetagenome_bin12]